MVCNFNVDFKINVTGLHVGTELLICNDEAIVSEFDRIIIGSHNKIREILLSISAHIKPRFD